MSEIDTLVLSNVQKSVTLEQFIGYKNDTDINYDTLSITTEIGDIRYPVKNVLTTDYLSDMKKLSIKVELSDEQFNFYKFKPKLLAHKLYGNAELYYLILALNNMANVKDFNVKSLYLIKTSDIKELISAIYSSEKDNL